MPATAGAAAAAGMVGVPVVVGAAGVEGTVAPVPAAALHAAPVDLSGGTVMPGGAAGAAAAAEAEAAAAAAVAAAGAAPSYSPMLTGASTGSVPIPGLLMDRVHSLGSSDLMLPDDLARDDLWQAMFGSQGSQGQQQQQQQ